MPRVDVARYMGHWYEIARFPKWFERDAHGVTADYSLSEDGTVSVVNTAHKGAVEGPIKKATAKAWPVEPGRSRFKVRFYWPFKGDYWIIMLDPDYRWAVVGNPNKTSLWILSRTPTLPEDEEREILRKVAALGYDTSKLEHGGQPEGHA